MYEKNLWARKFSVWPTWPCPACGSTALTRQKKNKSFLDEETGPSQRARNDENWDPEWIDRRFAAILHCHNPECGELVAVSGSVSIEEFYGYDDNGEEAQFRGDVFFPSYFDKAPPIFAVHKKCPSEVREHLAAAFSFIWCDLGGAANRLRAGVEALLDDQGVVKTRLDNRKRKPLTAHNRIERFALTQREAADYLMAIKWLGNIGSHGTAEDVSRDDLLDAMELFEAAIDRLYVKSAEKYAKVAAAMTKRKGKKRKQKK